MRSSIRYYFATLFTALFLTAGSTYVFALTPGESLQDTLNRLGLTGDQGSCAAEQSVIPDGGYSAAPDLEDESLIKYIPPKTFPETKVYDIQGDVVDLSKLAGGKWLLVNLWATWCPPCLIEMPALLELDKKLDDVNVAFLSLDFPMSPVVFKNKLENTKLPEGFSSYYTNDYHIWSLLGIEGVPTSFIISPDGLIDYMFLGERDWLAKESLAFFDDLVNN